MVFLISHQSDHLIDAPIAHLIDWSNEQAERLNLTVSRCQDRELHFRGTLELAKSTKQDRTLLSGMKYDSPQPPPRGAFSLIPVQVRGEADPKTNPDGCVDTSELVELIIRLDNARKDNSLVKAGITLDVVSPTWLASPCKTEYGWRRGTRSAGTLHRCN